MILKNLQKLRQEHHMSQKKLGKEIGYLSQQTIYKYESGLTEPALATVIKFAEYFNVSVDYLLGLTDVKHKVEKVKDSELNSKELNHINTYRQLNNEDRYVIDLMMLRLMSKSE